MSQKILIVEDDEVTALNLKMSLEKLGYEVVSTADTAIQARNKIKIYEPDLILLDISLQEMNDGIELAHYIHEKYALPFIFLTSHFENEVISAVMEGSRDPSGSFHVGRGFPLPTESDFTYTFPEFGKRRINDRPMSAGIR